MKHYAHALANSVILKWLSAGDENGEAKKGCWSVREPNLVRLLATTDVGKEIIYIYLGLVKFLIFFSFYNKITCLIHA
jgi:hypothetical protein